MKFTYLILLLPFAIAAFLVVKSVKNNRPSANPTHFSYLEIPIESLDPIHASSTSAQLILNNAFDGLVSWSATNGIQPQIAKRWETSKERREVRFFLDATATFHDGTPVTAFHVQKALHHLIFTPSYYMDHFRVIQSVSAESPEIISIQLRHPSPQLLFLLSGVAAKIVRREKGQIIGIGPFIPYPKANEVVLERAPSYYGAKPRTEQIVFLISTQAEALRRVQSGVLDDVATIPLEGTEIDRADGSWMQQPMWATWLVGFDQRVAPYQDPEIRKEIARHLRSEDFIRRVYPTQTPSIGIVPPGVPGYLDPGVIKPTTSPAIPFRAPKQKLEILIPDSLQRRNEIRDWIQTAMIGSDLRVVPRITSFAEMIRDYAKGKYGAFLLSINAEYPDPGFVLRALRSDSHSNYLGIRSTELDEMLDKMDSPEEMRDVNVWLARENATVNLMHVHHRGWVRKCVSGIETSPISEGYFVYRNVSNTCSR